MPLELGLALGARRFGSDEQRKKRFLIMVGKPFDMPKYMSDLAGNDPKSHQAEANRVVRIVRDFLRTTPDGAVLPATHLNELLLDCKRCSTAIFR